MQCFICVMYMMFLCGAHPPEHRTTSTEPLQRSLFRDVIESLRIRSQLPEDDNQNDENNLAQNYEKYASEDQPLQLPTDNGFIPRRNDRLEISSLRYRYPKSLEKNFTVDIETTETPKEEIVVFIDTTKDRSTTAKPKKIQKKGPRPSTNKTKNKLNENFEENNEEETQMPEESSSSRPMSNTLAGQSQIGNRESQIVVKPTVILNFRGSIMHKDGEVKLGGGRKNEENGTFSEPPQNVFNINQEIKLERTYAGNKNRGGSKKDHYDTNNNDNEGELKLESQVTTKVEHDTMVCETSTVEKAMPSNDQGRMLENVFQIMIEV